MRSSLSRVNLQTLRLAHARPYLQLEQLDHEIDLLNERRLEVDL